MTLNLVPSSFWDLSTSKFPSIWDEDFTAASGVSIYEDDKKVYVEAAVPGINPEEVEVTLDKNVLWIRGESKTEDKSKKYYKKATSNFSYRVSVPSNVDLKNDPEAVCKNGVMTVSFNKKEEEQPKKIAIKKS
ncbi:Hsp20/alpha crystallin family protein [Candidatus Nomurabacteria bacterium]|uniref:Hsp20/alpha crystallin family protein n=1 Tax=candidate division WWE3 bacterium TaxID=2053526 RepID=A0A955E0C6_UNCKA|nr:Hsp20/alpha crystallin family protein [candidate division WWE3 bacterium]MCB9823936.1 Hsp20/alpha crystallin family protein [Candidatus Nomurabacteria bacterium]MCB9827083.1 Hsp20/alpha crystallin family protein [Candidatus Nomurabacteria bacterium]MCB9827875.1 Hsp20/alpha crystallin family protein [Candidatus Nomurabacteria bacterium]HXK52889.1 Hsp20/alpha crystallin family protein [bacterium]